MHPLPRPNCCNWIIEPDDPFKGTLQVTSSYFHPWVRSTQFKAGTIWVFRLVPLFLITIFTIVDFGIDREELYSSFEHADNFTWIGKPFNFYIFLVLLSYVLLFRLFLVLPKKSFPYSCGIYIPTDFEPLPTSSDLLINIYVVVILFSILPPFSFALTFSYGYTYAFGIHHAEWTYLVVLILVTCFYALDVLIAGNHYISHKHLAIGLVYVFMNFGWCQFLASSGIIIYPAFDFTGSHSNASVNNMFHFVLFYYSAFILFWVSSYLKQTVGSVSTLTAAWFREPPIIEEEEKVNMLKDPYGV